MTLHIIKSAKADSILQILELATEDDQILLVEDGCYLYSLAKDKLAEACTSIFALSDHMQARGLSDKAKKSGIELIDFKQWVLLTHKHPQSTSW